MYQYIFFYCVGLPNSPEMFQLIIQEHKYVCGYYYFWKIIILKAKIFHIPIEGVLISVTS
jgi:hypothetical protein